MTRNRIAVTGTGCICALGDSVARCMDGLYRGDVQPVGTGIVLSSLSRPPAVFCAPWPVGHSDSEALTRTCRLALSAVAQAVRRGWPRGIGAPSRRVGVCMGTTVGCTFNEEPFYRAFHSGARPAPAAIDRFLGNDVSTVVADFLQADGPAVTVANACASGTDAIGLACGWLRAGVCDVVIAGGADELARFAFLGFASMSNTSTERCRPFDLDRQGLNLGEGAGAVVLEREEDARRRGAEVLAWVAGYGSASDAYHPTAPHPDGRGLRRALTVALEEAGLDPEAVGLVNAHGTGTQENDRIEGSVLAAMLPAGILVFSTKGYTGHTLGAAGAIEAVLTVHNLIDGVAPASGGFRTPDPACRIIPTTVATRFDKDVAVSSSLAFGGANSVLVFSRFRA